VPNPSFEDTVACPDATAEVDRATGWSSFRQSPDYFNTCADSASYASVPNNAAGYQQPHSGNAYCGFQTFFTSDYKEILGCQLSSPLTIGMEYFVTFKTVMAYGGAFGCHNASNKIGARFSTVPYNMFNPAPINNFAHVYTDSIVTDTLNWVTIQGSFIADSAYQYIALGNFFDDANTDTLGGGRAYYYVDDICVSTDSVTCNLLSENIKENIFNDTITLFPNPTSNLLNLSFQNFRDAEIIIYDRLGIPVFSTTVRNQNSLTLNIASFSPGVYLVKLVSEKDGRAVVRKLIKL